VNNIFVRTASSGDKFKKKIECNKLNFFDAIKMMIRRTTVFRAPRKFGNKNSFCDKKSQDKSPFQLSDVEITSSSFLQKLKTDMEQFASRLDRHNKTPTTVQPVEEENIEENEPQEAEDFPEEPIEEAKPEDWINSFKQTVGEIIEPNEEIVEEPGQENFEEGVPIETDLKNILERARLDPESSLATLAVVVMSILKAPNPEKWIDSSFQV
jgi:hypothetical protein